MTTRAEEIAGDGPYTAYQSAVDLTCWLVVERGTIGPVYEYSTPIHAGNAADALNAAHANGYKQGQQDRWVPIAEGTPSGHVWLTGHAYNDPRTGDYWQKPGYYHEGSLYADDDFDPWDGYPPTHWMPALPSPPNPEQR